MKNAILLMLLLTMPLVQASDYFINTTYHDDKGIEDTMFKAKIVIQGKNSIEKISSEKEVKTLLYCNKLEPISYQTTNAVIIDDKTNEYLVGIKIPKDTVPDNQFSTTCSININAGENVESTFIENIEVRREVSVYSFWRSTLNWVGKAVDSFKELFTSKRNVKA